MTTNLMKAGLPLPYDILLIVQKFLDRSKDRFMPYIEEEYDCIECIKKVEDLEQFYTKKATQVVVDVTIRCYFVRQMCDECLDKIYKEYVLEPSNEKILVFPK